MKNLLLVALAMFWTPAGQAVPKPYKSYHMPSGTEGCAPVWVVLPRGSGWTDKDRDVWESAHVRCPLVLQRQCVTKFMRNPLNDYRIICGDKPKKA